MVAAHTSLTTNQLAILHEFAGIYIWWDSAEQAVQQPERVVAQVKDIGEFDDCRILEQEFGVEYLQHVLSIAEPGWFRGRSWSWWHARVGLTTPPLRRTRTIPM